MNGFNYFINLKVINGGAFGQLSSMAQGFKNRLVGVSGGLDEVNKDLQTTERAGRAAFDGMGRSVAGLVAQVGAAAFTLSSLITSAQTDSLNNAIRFVGGVEGARNLEFIGKTVSDLHLPMQASLEGFKTLSGGMMESGVSMAEQRNIFKSVGEAALVMGLDAETTKGAFLALGQMASKGTVSAEELRGQLGERLPGAVNIAARAMGVTTAKLSKMLEQGEVISAEFLPKFANELHKTFGSGVQDALGGSQSKLNQFGNAIFELKNQIGTGLMPVATALISNVLIPMFTWIGQNKDLLFTMAGAVGVGVIAWNGYTLYAGIAASTSTGLTAVLEALNLTILANPMFWLITVVVAFGAAIVYAWNHVSGFRAGLTATWTAIKEFGSILYDYGLAPLMAFAKTLIGVFTFDTSKIAEGLEDGFKAIEKIAYSKSIGERMGTAFNSGWNSQMGEGTLGAFPSVATPGAVGSAFGKPDSKDGSGKGAKGAKQMSDNITGGGQRNVTINFNGKMIESLNLHTTTVREGAEQIRDIIIREMYQVINAPNQMQGG